MMIIVRMVQRITWLNDVFYPHEENYMDTSMEMIVVKIMIMMMKSI